MLSVVGVSQELVCFKIAELLGNFVEIILSLILKVPSIIAEDSILKTFFIFQRK